MPRAVLAVLAAVALSAPAAASAKAPPPAYLVLRGGGYFPVSGDLDGYETGFDGEFAFGYAPDPGFAFEIGTGWMQTSSSLSTIRVIPATITIRGTVTVDRFQPYVLAGGGAYFVRQEVGGVSDDQVDLGGYLGAGANLNLTRTVFIGVEARYLWLATETFAVNKRLDGATLNAGLGFRF
jgi:opacity protein-like surface antigen